jgi:hypothetical protein
MDFGVTNAKSNVPDEAGSPVRRLLRNLKDGVETKQWRGIAV